MKTLLILLFFSTIRIGVNGEQLVVMKFDEVGRSTKIFQELGQLYLVKTKSAILQDNLQPVREEDFTIYKIISLPDDCGTKIDVNSELIVDPKNETKLVKLTYTRVYEYDDQYDVVYYPKEEKLNKCEQNILMKNKGYDCKSINDPSPFWLKLSPHKFFFYKTKITVSCSQMTSTGMYKQNIVELSPNCNIKNFNNSLNYTAPMKVTNLSYPELIPIDISNFEIEQFDLKTTTESTTAEPKTTQETTTADEIIVLKASAVAVENLKTFTMIEFLEIIGLIFIACFFIVKVVKCMKSGKMIVTCA